MRGRTDRLKASCLCVAVGLVAMLAFATPRAGADPPAWVPGTLPADDTVQATSSAGATYSYTPPSATDTELLSAVDCVPASGSTFALGPTTVTCTATDTGDNSQITATFTVTVVDTTGPTVTVTPPGTTEATSASGASVTFAASATDIVDGSVTTTCAPASGTTFALGTTTVTCTATDAHSNPGSATFTVTVHDTTAPSLGALPADITNVPATGPGGAVVNYTPPTATDTVDASPTVTCAPGSGSTFPVGNTTVSCTATDNAGNTSSAGTFHVTVVDTVNPTLTNVPSNMTAPATSPGGASVSYSSPGATDNVDPSPTVACSPASGSTFALGTTTVTCTATDSSGNHASAGFTITVTDTAAPTLTGPGNKTAEATGPSGAAVAFTVTAVDNVDPSPAVNCTPASGSTFALGATTVNCTGRDSAGNTANTSFTVNVVDTTPPAFSNVPGPLVFESNSASGTLASYTLPTAVDLVSGAIPVVACTPPSGTQFPLGTTMVQCSAGDSHGNIGHVSFAVTIADRTAPIISAPPSLSIYATTPTGIPATDPAVADATRFITAADLIDPHPVITSDMPDFLPLGHTLVRFYATDKSGNRAGVNMDVLVLKPPASGPIPPLANPDVQPPDNVSKLNARLGNSTITLTWIRPTAADFDHVVIYRSDPTSPSLGDSVYTGKATKFVDRGLTNGTQYRYVVASYDTNGNRSVGLAILATPQLRKLARPVDGAVVKVPPLLIWLAVGGADYYNVQLFRESTKTLSESYLTSSKKILSAWPKGTRLPLKRQWKFEGRTYRLTPGTYRWFVWPGFGRRTEENYGPLLGQSTFVVKR